MAIKAKGTPPFQYIAHRFNFFLINKITAWPFVGKKGVIIDRRRLVEFGRLSSTIFNLLRFIA